MQHLRHASLLLLVAAGLLGLGGCPGSVITPLPAGGGQGSYAGEFSAEDGSTILGTFNITVDAVGAITGSGVLNGQSVTLSGVLAGDEVEAWLTETLSQLTGRFRGTRTGSGYSGEFTLNQLAGADDLTGYWDCAPSA